MVKVKAKCLTCKGKACGYYLGKAYCWEHIKKAKRDTSGGYLSLSYHQRDEKGIRKCMSHNRNNYKVQENSTYSKHTGRFY
jgi:hypothetical protein